MFCVNLFIFRKSVTTQVQSGKGTQAQSLWGYLQLKIKESLILC